MLFNEGGGTKVYDLSGYNNHGTIYGATWVKLPNGKWTLSFDGDDYIEIPDSDSLDIIGKMTIAFWLYLDDIKTQQELMGHGVYAGGGWFIIKSIYNLSNLYLEIEDYTGGAGCRADGILSFGWHFYAVTYDDDIDIVQFFKDGILFTTKTCTRSMTASSLPLRIGTVTKASYLSGKIGEVLIYSRVLNPLEMRELYQITRRLIGA